MREDGFITIADPEKDRALETIPTLQCCHCGAHWEHRPGSGVVRGYCARCNGPVCGPCCKECVPYMQRIENVEAGRPAMTPKPTMISVGKLWTPEDK